MRQKYTLSNSMRVFEQYPEFISTDVRQHRTAVNSYKITEDLQTARHEALLPPTFIKGRSILDLGCCVGATGAWALHHGAKRYTGIDLEKQFVEQASSNLSKYFLQEKWSVIETSVEDFLINNKTKYDIIVASGIIYAFIDYHKFVKQLTSISGSVIIETQHPFFDWYNIISKCLPDDKKDEILSSFDPIPLLDNFPITMIKPTSMVKGQNNEHYEGGWGSFPSLKMLQVLFSNENFVIDVSAYEKLKKAIPELYGPMRYACVFHRKKETKKYPTVLELTNLDPK